jgi:hypothetical protein
MSMTGSGRMHIVLERIWGRALTQEAESTLISGCIKTTPMI